MEFSEGEIFNSCKTLYCLVYAAAADKSPQVCATFQTNTSQKVQPPGNLQKVKPPGNISKKFSLQVTSEKIHPPGNLIQNIRWYSIVFLDTKEQTYLCRGCFTSILYGIILIMNCCLGASSKEGTGSEGAEPDSSPLLEPVHFGGCVPHSGQPVHQVNILYIHMLELSLLYNTHSNSNQIK